MKKTIYKWSRISSGSLLIGTFILGILAVGCSSPNSTESSSALSKEENYPDRVEINHSIGFDIEYGSGHKLLHLFRHYNDVVDTVSYLLVQNGVSAPKQRSGLTTITIPVENIVSMSTTHLGMFKLLDAMDVLKGVESKTYINSEEVRSRIEAGQIMEVAAGGAMNVEQVVANETDLVMGVGYPNAQNESYQQLERTGIPVLLNADWQERNLLGRAEWIKVLAALLNKEELANREFGRIEREYQEVLEKVENQAEHSPLVITGIAQGDSWHVAGGKSFAYNLLKIANVEYPWKEDSSTGSLKLDFETVYEAGLKADYWMAPSNVKTMQGILDRDERYRDFKSFKEGRIYNIYGRYTEGGGNDFYEMGIMEPHIILKDIVKIFHPELLPDHQLVYYARLR